LLLDALGKRIDDPAAMALSEAIGKKPFKSATPNNSYVAVARKLGLEAGTSMCIKNRSYWPYRKEGRLWVTWVSHAFLYPNYRGSLPAGFDWHMDDATLSTRFERRIEGALRCVRFALPQPREGLGTKAELDSNGRLGLLYVHVIEERDYATIHPDAKPEKNVEDGFFAAWCALNGILRERQLVPGCFDALHARRITPLNFFSKALAGLLWEADVKPEYESFCYAYMNRLMEPDEATELHDVRQIFGEKNYWRKAGEPITEDGWHNYDRIALRYTQRLEQWRRGEISSRVDWPGEVTLPR
jgi:hypothetical protein